MKYRPKILFILAVILLPFSCSSQPSRNSQIVSQTEIEKHLEYLCHPKCEGRGPHTAGVDTAAQYIADALKSFYINPPSAYPHYFQTFERMNFDYKVSQTQEIHLTTKETEISYNYPYVNACFRSPSGKVSGDLVFAGYGMDTPEYSDYSNLDVTGKIVLIMRNEPRFISDLNIQDKEGKGSINSQLVHKVETAKKHGALAVVFIGDPENQMKLKAAENKNVYMRSHNKFPYATGENKMDIPVLMMDPELLEKVIPYNKLIGIQQTIEQTKETYNYPLESVRATLNIDIKVDQYSAKNVLAVIPGNDPVLRQEAIIIGAHYDQDGYRKKKPLPGADDNASGTAGLLAIAKALKESGNSKRTYILVAYGAEEPKGGTAETTGSEFFLSHIRKMGFDPYAGINLDMIGRAHLVKASLFSWTKNLFRGWQTNKIFYSSLPGCSSIDSICLKCNDITGLELMDQNPWNKNVPFLLGDHARFFNRGIPYLTFYDGNRRDLHKHRDKKSKINLKKVQKVSQLAYHIAWDLANSTSELSVDRSKWLESYADFPYFDYRY